MFRIDRMRRMESINRVKAMNLEHYHKVLLGRQMHLDMVKAHVKEYTTLDQLIPPESWNIELNHAFIHELITHHTRMKTHGLYLLVKKSSTIQTLQDTLIETLKEAVEPSSSSSSSSDMCILAIELSLILNNVPENSMLTGTVVKTLGDIHNNVFDMLILEYVPTNNKRHDLSQEAIRSALSNVTQCKINGGAARILKKGFNSPTLEKPIFNRIRQKCTSY